MEGADKYAKVFKTGQIDRFYVVSSSHARGLTFNIQLLPKDEQAIPNGSNNLCTNKNAVHIFGPIPNSGQLGWSESYGWLYEGKWQEDFELLYRSKLLQKQHEYEDYLVRCLQSEQSEKVRIQKLLSNY